MFSEGKKNSNMPIVAMKLSLKHCFLYMSKHGERGKTTAAGKDLVDIKYFEE